jgi:hypothetical protein
MALPSASRIDLADIATGWRDRLKKGNYLAMSVVSAEVRSKKQLEK